MTKVRKVTLKLSPGALAKHGGGIQGGRAEVKEESESLAGTSPVETPIETPRETSTATPPPNGAAGAAGAGGGPAAAGSGRAAPKLSSNIRVGVSGLTMNAPTSRKVDRSAKRVARYTRTGHFAVRTFSGYTIPLRKWVPTRE